MSDFDRKKDFIIYVDDGGNRVEAFVDVLELNQHYVRFKTYSGNIITIPMGKRIIKVKERGALQ